MMKFRSACPIASTLDIVGDRWSLLLLRSLALGPASYSDFLAHAEKISTNILAERLRRLEEAGVIAQAFARRGSIRGTYILTAKGAALVPALQQIARWGEEYIPNRWKAPDRFYAFDPASYSAEESDSDLPPEA